MEHFKKIYTSKASEYARLEKSEDVYNNLSKALEGIISFSDKKILDIGSGTGRIARLFHSHAKHIIAIDLYIAMLRQNKVIRKEHNGRWSIFQADMINLPIVHHWADITIAGWAIGHLRSWFKNAWQTRINQVVQQMNLATSNGGHIFIIETLGTGSLEPAPPTDELRSYYLWLEDKMGFRRKVIRTDYNFDTIESAVQVMDFFFGIDLANRIKENRWHRVPEWTGIWWTEV